jgi:alanine racemase
VQPSLEYSRVDLTGLPHVATGDEVVIIGSQGQETIAPLDVVRFQGVASVHDVMLEVKPTVQRVYREVRSHNSGATAATKPPHQPA